MGRKFWIVAILVPILCCFLLKYQDADFILMMYEIIGQDPATALRGKVVWITGASSGIGEYLAYELSKYGCKLVLSARRKTELERVKENCAGKREIGTKSSWTEIIENKKTNTVTTFCVTMTKHWQRSIAFLFLCYVHLCKVLIQM